VLEKLELVQWLVGKKSLRVSKNPQGFLIKAIEDDKTTEQWVESHKGTKAATKNNV
jgi:hypothetical protein